MQHPRKHHYLPQFYLRGFSTDQRSLFQIEKATGRHYQSQIKDTAAIRDFHEIDADGIDDPYRLEKSLAERESELADTLRVFLADGTSNKPALAGVIRLLSMLRMRVPAVKQHIERSLSSMIRVSAKILEQSGRLPQPPPGLEDDLRIDNLNISVTNWKCMEFMFGMAEDEDILNIFTRMRATLYRCSSGQLFVTSDQPVALFHPTPGSTNSYGVGPAIKEVEITLPLTSSSLLKLDHEPGQHLETLATPDEVKEFNRRTIIMAQSYIFTREQPQDVAAQIGLLSNIFAGFRFEDLHTNGSLYQVQRCIPASPA